MESGAKIGNFLLEGHRNTFWIKNIKVPFVIGHPHLHIKSSLYVCRRVQGLQIFKQNWIISIHSRVIVILLICVFLALGGGAGGWGVLGWSALVYMSSVMFRGKESSNRIELSRLVQDLLNFGVLGSLWLWGWGVWVDGVGGWLEGAPHICAHACTCTHVHACTRHVVNMIISCKWLPPLGEFPMMSYMCTCVCMCVHAHACACGWGAPSHHPPSHPPTPQHPGGTPRIIQNSIALELIEIFQFCLKIWNLWRLPHIWVGV